MKNENEYEIEMKYLWNKLETLLKYENKRLTYEMFNEIIDDENFDIDSVNVSISMNKDYERMFGRKMYDDLCKKYKQYINGRLDEDKKRLYRIWKSYEDKKYYNDFKYGYTVK
tara:strand:- start:180 stop:518 length:339 start_codon:yes stop_codon:yes gene_type:complete